jgi:hypothetical protein
MTTLFKKLMAAGCVLVLLGSCGQQQEQVPQTEAVLLYGDDTELATVNDQPITQYEVTRLLEKTLGDRSVFVVSEVKHKALQSLVASRAITLLAEKELEPYTIAEVEKQVAAYREEIYVQRYLQENASIQPVSRKMITEYYQRNKAQFGEVRVKKFEMVKSVGKLTAESRSQLMAKLDGLNKVTDWQQAARSLRDEGFNVGYQQAEANPGLLDQQIKQLVNQTSMNEASNILTHDGALIKVRVTGERVVPGKTVEEVSADIRRLLAPGMLKQAVAEVSEKALGTVDVKYMKKQE